MKIPVAKLCQGCQKRRAKYVSSAKKSDRRVRADHDHDLCFQCARAQWNRDRLNGVRG